MFKTKHEERRIFWADVAFVMTVACMSWIFGRHIEVSDSVIVLYNLSGMTLLLGVRGYTCRRCACCGSFWVRHVPFENYDDWQFHRRKVGCLHCGAVDHPQ